MKKFPRLSQIASFQSSARSSYFHCAYEELHKTDDFEECFSSYERDLAMLDESSWLTLRDDAKMLCVTKDKNERWNCLFEKLNEARGYAFLKSIGCQKVRFIPPSTQNRIESPDLEGEKGSTKILCEVKTKNASDLYVEAVNDSRVIRTNEFLPVKLKEILEKTFIKARSQLNSIPGSNVYKKYIYLNIEYDNEGVDPSFRAKLNIQTRNAFDSMGFSEIELVIYNENSQI